MGQGIGTQSAQTPQAPSAQGASGSTGAGGLIGGIIGSLTDIVKMTGQKKRERRAMRNQQKLMDIQQKNQMALNQQGHDLQYKMWEDTNYNAQKEQMEKAGLNVGMMYGGSGAGGSTTGSQGGGSAGGGSAPSPQPMEIGAIQNGIQLALMKAQKDNIEADTEAKRSGVAYQSGVQTQNTQEEINARKMENETRKMGGQEADIIEAYNRGEKAKSEGKMLYGEWSGKNGGEKWNERKPDAQNRAEEIIENLYETSKTGVEKQKADLKLVEEQIRTQVENQKLTKEQANKIWHEIRQNWTKIGIDGAMKLIKGGI